MKHADPRLTPQQPGYPEKMTKPPRITIAPIRRVPPSTDVNSAQLGGGKKFPTCERWTVPVAKGT